MPEGLLLNEEPLSQIEGVSCPRIESCAKSTEPA